MNEAKPANSMRTYFLAAIPLILFAAIAVIFFKQLTSGTNNQTLPSVLINKPAPAYPTEPLVGLKVNGIQVPAISKNMTNGNVTLVNVWASWCVPCRQEHPVLYKLAQERKDITLVGINYKDKTPNALRFLGALGNPYSAVSIDPAGAASIDWGVYGIPETYVLNRSGEIILKHVGPISDQIMADKIMPVVEKALIEKGTPQE